MKRTLLGAIAAFFSLAGCTTHPPTPNATINVQDITYAILTELYCSAKDLREENSSYLTINDGWIAALELSLSASIEGSVSPSVSLLGPFNLAKAIPSGGSTGSFTAAVGGAFDQTRTNASDYKIYIDLNTLVNDWPTVLRGDPHCKDPNRNAGGTYLQGNLGLTAWLQPTFITQQGTRQFAPPPLTPIVTGVSGPAATGDNVTISGKYFTGTTAVLFGKVQAKVDPSLVTDTTIKTQVPAPQMGSAKTVDVTVTASGGTSATTSADHFVYKDIKELAAAGVTGPGGGGAPSGASQIPTIGSTFTFTIKSTGTVGPSFVLTRASGGSTSLFSLIRTDTNYVNIVLTPTSYCSVAGQTCSKSADPTGDARNRIESTLATLNIKSALTPLNQVLP